MLRMFATHRIRKQTGLSSCLWDFTTLPEDGSEQIRRKMAVPGCWQNAPGTRTYRGKACYERSFSAGGNLRLEFKGVCHTAEIYLDGEKIASHYNRPRTMNNKGIVDEYRRPKLAFETVKRIYHEMP